jgi:hypothetical protein
MHSSSPSYAVVRLDGLLSGKLSSQLVENVEFIDAADTIEKLMKLLHLPWTQKESVSRISLSITLNRLEVVKRPEDGTELSDGFIVK